jgi:hypothetical protein
MVLEHSRPVEPLGESPEAIARVRYGTSGIRSFVHLSLI